MFILYVGTLFSNFLFLYFFVEGKNQPQYVIKLQMLSHNNSSYFNQMAKFTFGWKIRCREACVLWNCHVSCTVRLTWMLMYTLRIQQQIFNKNLVSNESLSKPIQYFNWKSTGATRKWVACIFFYIVISSDWH